MGLTITSRLLQKFTALEEDRDTTGLESALKVASASPHMSSSVTPKVLE